MKLKPGNIVFMLIFGIAALISGTCDHTDLHGKIVFNQEKIHPGDTVKARLILPEKFQNVHGVMWRIEPEDSVKLDSTILGHSKLKKINGEYRVTDSSDRIARFIPLKAGNYTIEVEGFFKQTNPQPITKKHIRVLP